MLISPTDSSVASGRSTPSLPWTTPGRASACWTLSGRTPPGSRRRPPRGSGGWRRLPRQRTTRGSSPGSVIPEGTYKDHSIGKIGTGNSLKTKNGKSVGYLIFCESQPHTTYVCVQRGKNRQKINQVVLLQKNTHLLISPFFPTGCTTCRTAARCSPPPPASPCPPPPPPRTSTRSCCCWRG